MHILVEFLSGPERSLCAVLDTQGCWVTIWPSQEGHWINVCVYPLGRVSEQ